MDCGLPSRGHHVTVETLAKGSPMHFPTFLFGGLDFGASRLGPGVLRGTTWNSPFLWTTFRPHTIQLDIETGPGRKASLLIRTTSLYLLWTYCHACELTCMIRSLDVSTDVTPTGSQTPRGVSCVVSPCRIPCWFVSPIIWSLSGEAPNRF
jgi:hypothetical protein